MSQTPVREALERLVGEGLLVSTADRHGFAIPRLTVRDVAGLHLLFGTLLRGLPAPSPDVVDDGWEPDDGDPSAAVSAVVARAHVDGRSAIIAAAVRSTDLRLATYRRVEPTVIGDWSEGLRRLRSGLARGGPRLAAEIASFTKARTGAAAEIVAAVEDMQVKRMSDRHRI